MPLKVFKFSNPRNLFFEPLLSLVFNERHCLLTLIAFCCGVVVSFFGGLATQERRQTFHMVAFVDLVSFQSLSHQHVLHGLGWALLRSYSVLTQSSAQSMRILGLGLLGKGQTHLIDWILVNSSSWLFLRVNHWVEALRVRPVVDEGLKFVWLDIRNVLFASFLHDTLLNLDLRTVVLLGGFNLLCLQVFYLQVVAQKSRLLFL